MRPVDCRHAANRNQINPPTDSLTQSTMRHLLVVLITAVTGSTAEKIAHRSIQSGESIRIRSNNHPQKRMLYQEISPKNIRQYTLWSAELITQTLKEWAHHYPDLVRVTTSQEAFGLPAAGTHDDCPFDAEVEGCLNYIITIQDFLAHPEGSNSSNHLPEVLWSGEVHGDERVGPTATLEAAQILLEATTCEALPRRILKDTQDWENEIANAKQCRDNLFDYGIQDADRQWLARLVTTRRIVIVPTANALGYYRNVREEDGVDPNRDFPYDLTDSSLCMQSIAARTLNEGALLLFAILIASF
jgi:hypothetical protein